MSSPATGQGQVAPLQAKVALLQAKLQAKANLRTFSLVDPVTVFRNGLRLHHIANTAYPIGHRNTIWQHRAGSDRHQSLLLRELANSDPMSLYVHIPFCESRCKFCEYTVIANPSKEQEEQYHHGLLRELRMYTERLKLEGKPLAGFDIGGGTPSLIDPEKIHELVSDVRKSFVLAPGFGMSIETTPRIAALKPERLKVYRDCGIDRISMGLQMVNPALLRAYERDMHKVSLNELAVRNIRDARYREFNIDLMYGFALQTTDDFLATLRETVRLSPDVITLYRMRYKGTRVEDESPGIDYETVHQMYESGRQLLLASGYHGNPGKNCFTKDPSSPGTSPYLTSRVVEGMPYLGIGLGAQTFTCGVLAYNHGAATKRLGEYLAAVAEDRLPIQDLYDLPAREGMAKMVAVSFYFGEIDLDAFHKRFGQPLETAYPNEVNFVLDCGLMEYRDRKLRLTGEGAKHFPGVIALFYSDAVKEHLHERAEVR